MLVTVKDVIQNYGSLLKKLGALGDLKLLKNLKIERLEESVFVNEKRIYMRATRYIPVACPSG